MLQPRRLKASVWGLQQSKMKDEFKTGCAAMSSFKKMFKALLVAAERKQRKHSWFLLKCNESEKDLAQSILGTGIPKNIKCCSTRTQTQVSRISWRLSQCLPLRRCTRPSRSTEVKLQPWQQHRYQQLTW